MKAHVSAGEEMQRVLNNLNTLRFSDETSVFFLGVAEAEEQCFAGHNSGLARRPARHLGSGLFGFKYAQCCIGQLNLEFKDYRLPKTLLSQGLTC